MYTTIVWYSSQVCYFSILFNSDTPQSTSNSNVAPTTASCGDLEVAACALGRQRSTSCSTVVEPAGAVC